MAVLPLAAHWVGGFPCRGQEAPQRALEQIVDGSAAVVKWRSGRPMNEEACTSLADYLEMNDIFRTMRQCEANRSPVTSDQQEARMFSEMASIAVDCVRHPGRRSTWSPELGRYVCPDMEEGRRAAAMARGVIPTPEREAQIAKHPPINPQFKLVFLTAAGGTLLFAALCIVLTFAIGKEPKPLFEKVVMGMFDLVKIGFGALVGLLGGKTLQGKPFGSVAAEGAG